MPSTLPDGEPVPSDGALPDAAAAELPARDLGVYLHVPFCTVRCGYCDFNTYTASELGGLSPQHFLAAAHAEIDLAARTLQGAPAVSTIFVGGGTPSVLTGAHLAELVNHVVDVLGLAEGAEITTEANPESTTPDKLAAWRAAGVNRLSLGMQSAVPHVLAVLDRTHTPGRVLEVVHQARAAGFEDVSVDLIMGTPGESPNDWQSSLDAVLTADVDHVSAYALIVEPGTRLAAQIRRGEIAAPDDDALADTYVMADRVLSAAGFENYEVSNWARSRGGAHHRSRHNLAYWTSQHWWGVGPGAHSHVGGVRWWNVKHPGRYAMLLADRQSPAAGREVLDGESRRIERVLLELRTADGLPRSVLTPTERQRVAPTIARGLMTLRGDHLVLTLQGRLLADAVIRDLLD